MKTLIGRLPAVFWLAWIILLGTIARAVLLDGVVLLESTGTSYKAWELSKIFDIPSIGGIKDALKFILATEGELRVLVLIQGIVYSLFGVTELTNILPMFLAYISSTAAIYLIGRHWLSEISGVTAALLWAILPLSIFYSINLLPTILLLTLDIAVIGLYWAAKSKQSLFLYLVTALLFAVGISSSWVIFLPTLFLFAIWHEPEILRLLKLEFILAASFILFLFTGTEALLAYYQLLLPLDNLWMLPLLAITLVSSSASRHPSVSRLLKWFGVKSAWLFIFAPLIYQNAELIPQGMASYWLMLMLPIVILLGWELSSSGTDKKYFLLFALLGISSWFIILLAQPDVARVLSTISNIFIGLATLMAFSLLLHKSVPKRVRSALLALAFISFSVSSSAIVNSYVASYGKPSQQLNQAWDFFSEKRQEQRVIVFAEETLYTGLMFKHQFGTSPLDNKKAMEVLPLQHISAPEDGQFILLTQDRLSSIGTLPQTWELVKEIVIPGATNMLIYMAH